MSLNASDAASAGDEETVSVIAPAPEEIFEKRSLRLQSLAPNHPAGEYLEAMARLARAQQAALQALPATDEEHSLPASYFNTGYHLHYEIWQTSLAVIIPEMQRCPLPKESRDTLLRLKAAAPAELESAARAMLCGNYESIDLAGAPFLAAALQVYWTNLASRIRLAPAKQISYLCPVCDSPPVAGVVHPDRKLRYLCCSLCATLWYVPRLTCTNCRSTADLAYFNVVGDEGARCETCRGCNTYIKLFYLEKNPDAEPLADDLATLTLDLLMSEKSFSRSGLNLFLLPNKNGSPSSL